MDQMWVLQERDQSGVTVTSAQDDHLGGQRLEEQKALSTMGGSESQGPSKRASGKLTQVLMMENTYLRGPENTVSLY